MNLILYTGVESTCAQKVRLVLSEKRLEWTEHLLNLREGEQFAPEYLRLNPKAVVPTLVHEGDVIRESTVINEYLDHAFPDPPLKPADRVARARMRLLVKTFDDDVHPALGILCYAVFLRPQMNATKSPQELEAHFQKIADPARRERQRGTHEAGLKSPTVGPAVTMLAKVVADMEDALAHGPWLAGESYSLADAAAAPYVVRMEAVGLADLWSDRPKVYDWYQRVRDRRNCQELRDPWGTAEFAAMVAGYADQSRSEITEFVLQAKATRQKH
ncbi:MAG: glutathione S-transferase family protein [Steroidobacteraceae bacterium]